MASLPFTIKPVELLGGINPESGATPVFEATWYAAGAVNDGLEFHVAPGALGEAAWLTADMLLDGDESAVFLLELQEGQDGPCFQLKFALLPQASARLRLPLAVLSLGQARLPREGAWLKPAVNGDAVRPGAVSRLRLLVASRGEQPTRWCMTPLVASAVEPLVLDQPVLPRGALLDPLGQTALRTWSGKSQQQAEVSQRLRGQLSSAPTQAWPRDFTEQGAWRRGGFEASGWFRTHHDGQRWWLVAPDGHAFWSAGLNGLRASVETCISHMQGALDWAPDNADFEFAAVRRQREDQELVDFLQANLMRAFGPNTWHRHWTTIALSWLHRAGFNTIGHDSEGGPGRFPGIPWTRTLQPLAWPRAAFIWRDLPDVFDPQFVEDARLLASQLLASREDSSLLGYFLMDTPAWSLSAEPPAAGMLYNTETCHSRRALLDFLRERYGDESTLGQAWRMTVSFDNIRAGRWSAALSATARRDLADFSVLLLSHYFNILTTSCRSIDPHHLNLGPRWQGLPPDWCRQVRHGSDVFSMSCDSAQISSLDVERFQAEQGLPVLISAWSVGALDAGLPASGPGPRVAQQDARGPALRACLENAAALPGCVGLHYDALYDRSALGDLQGEAWNSGLLDICHLPCETLVAAARQALDNLYALASGEVLPTRDSPQIFASLAY
ncbi:MAG: hypothetical protein OXP68_02500 [Anaerolineaceae bacterium]|nr:hypothetical protein [Anaerolineaceae bacterium]